MSSRHHRSQFVPTEPDLGLERIVFFNDAVMAIAITLLAIDIRVPDMAANVAAAEMPTRLQALAPQILSFAISFMVIGVYWMSHHRYFRYIRRYDNRLIILNLFFLLFIAFMPFVASLFGQYSYLNLAIMVYSLSVSVIGFALLALWWHASHDHHLIDADMDPHQIRQMNVTAMVGPVVFLVAAPLALYSSILPVILWCLSPLVSVILARTVR